ncbi:MAG: phosphodiesterase, partial [Marinovum sp.]|nr:phosphodiesterase [Marinovum sp.]
EVKSNGLAVLCWTVTSEREEIRARRIADNITFEGYPANIAP